MRRDLKLDARVEVLPSESVAWCPQPDGSQLTIWRDTQRTAREIARFSAVDAEAYPGFVDLMSRCAAVLAGLMEMTPPDLPELGLRDLRSGLSLFGPLRRLGRKRLSELLRMLPMPSDELPNEYFESNVVKAAIGASSVLNANWGPRKAGTAYTLLANWAQSDTGLFRSAAVVKGGMGALTGALAAYAPGVRESILHRHILTPNDLESRFGLPEGNPNHGEMTLDQFFHMRPVPGHARYRTPIDGTYLCGAGLTQGVVLTRSPATMRLVKS